MYKPTRLLEYVCFYPVEIPTEQDGDVYNFIAQDIYSQFVFSIGIEQQNDIQTVLKHLKLLMEDKEFVKQRDKGFTIVLHKHEEHRKEIEAVIVPYGGKMIVDDLLVTENIAPVIEHMFKHFASNPNRN